ncbi:Six-hairpin glycosidase-like protein [Aspergillus pseudotamarii]|uniref:Six-hairpin glycosidase-like protein n=1 Tax=Aspergillus pseudotamarii TaxID=132259 RepID=A0A5N6SL56_ASPPS|nr:Six-hairpin glycosidase-like protein [Aspergillus pseudotamarii]KAE8135275.1 Six-hairpin glycosidase-like protein [Aspergillus pseudotamarii]
MLNAPAILGALTLVLSPTAHVAAAEEPAINRENVVRRYNPIRTKLSTTTPMQVGNGNFAFGADITGLQTLLPFNILSSWCWCNDSLPIKPNQTEPSDFTGMDWWTHDRLVNYDIQNPAEPEISQWLVANPHRVNLGRVGFLYNGKHISIDVVTGIRQSLDLYSGILTSKFNLDGQTVSVTTIGDPSSAIIGVDVQSSLLRDGSLAVFFDYPLTTGVNKFEAPFVGNWTSVADHTTALNTITAQKATIRHSLGGTTYYNTIEWEQSGHITGPFPETHRYLLQPAGNTSRFTFTTQFAALKETTIKPFKAVKEASTRWWAQYWESGSFVDLTEAGSSDAEELQRRIILSQYLLAVNSAGKDPPQESGLQNNGWYGKFHLEMVFWHLGHWARWNKWDILERSLGVYSRFLPSSLERAERQGYAGARLGKMSDPSGASAPGSQNALLIWQQPHPMYFAELEYRASPNIDTLNKWDHILDELATWMVSYAWWNVSTQVYDLGPPMYPSSENTSPNSTYNPTFELAYWRFGLKIASDWKRRQGISVPESWTRVFNNLAPLPIVHGAYSICADLPDMWNESSYTSDHPSQIAVYGLLPPTAGVDPSTVHATMDLIAQTWNFTASYGWDFPMLAMTSLRLSNVDQAISYLLHSNFQFDDVGNPVGTVVPTPYFPASSAFLLAIAMMAGGWDGQEGMHFPENWGARVDGFSAGI